MNSWKLRICISTEGAQQTSPGQSAAPPWVRRTMIREALQGRNNLPWSALAGLGGSGDNETQGGAALCPGLVCCAPSVHMQDAQHPYAQHFSRVPRPIR